MHAYTCVLYEMSISRGAFCSDAFTMSGVDKYISLLTRIFPAHVLLISSLNPLNVSGDRIARIASFSHSIIPTNWSLLPFQPVSSSHDFSQLSNSTNHSLNSGTLVGNAYGFSQSIRSSTFEFRVLSLFLSHSCVFILPPFRVFCNLSEQQYPELYAQARWSGRFGL